MGMYKIDILRDSKHITLIILGVYVGVTEQYHLGYRIMTLTPGVQKNNNNIWVINNDTLTPGVNSNDTLILGV